MYEIIIVSGDDDINELVCKIKEPLDKSKTFLIEIYGQNGATDPGRLAKNNEYQATTNSDR